MSVESAPPPNYVAPLYTYHHVNGTPTGCAITGGHFYNPNGVQFPSQYVGKYFFADVCGGFVRLHRFRRRPAPIPASTPFSTGVIAAVDLALTSNGALYVLQRGNPVGLLIKYVYPSNPERPWTSTRTVTPTSRSGARHRRLVPAEQRERAGGHRVGHSWRQTHAWRLRRRRRYRHRGVSGRRTARGTSCRVRTASSAIRFFGQNGDVPMPGDYDGDGKTDPAVFRPSTSTWFIQRSSDGQATIMNWGLSTDTPASGDYDGDGRTDIAIWRPSEGRYYIVPSTTNIPIAANWGAQRRPCGCRATTTTTARSISRSSGRPPARGGSSAARMAAS
jgi:hypothetical protein